MTHVIIIAILSLTTVHEDTCSRLVHYRSSSKRKQQLKTKSSITPEKERKQYLQVGPIPLVFALKLGCSMETVILQLLQADSHDSLRTMDPVTQLPPFAIAAMSSSSSSSSITARTAVSVIVKNEDDQSQKTTSRGKHNDNGRSISSCSNSNNINEPGKLLSPSLSLSSSSVSSSNHCYYKVDDIYRLLLAHPQVLSEYHN